MKNNLLISLLAGLIAIPAWGAGDDCPSATDMAAMNSYLNNVATQAKESYGGEEVIAKLDKCYGAKKKVPACLQRTYDYAEQQYARYGEWVPADNELNMRRPPEELRAPNPDDPNGEPGLVLFQKNPYKDAEQIAKEKGWPVVRYKSRHSGGFDSGTSSLMMIQVPGNKRTPPVDYDQYINIALPPDELDRQGAPQSQLNPLPSGKIPRPEDYEAEGGYSLPKTTTILTVRKGGPNEEPLIVFNKFDRYEGSVFKSDGMRNGLGSCYSCHPNGMRAISPLGYGVDAEQHANGQVFSDPMWKAIREMNNSMNSNQRYRLPSWGTVRTSDGKLRPALNANGFGPVWGPVKPLTRKVTTRADGTKVTEFPTRSKEFITGAEGCAKRETTINVTDIFGRAAGSDNIFKWKNSMPMDWKKVAKAMNCASCHNNEVHGAFNSQTDKSTIMYKILVDKSMPLWSHHNPADRASASDPAVQDTLNMNERIALYNCLSAEFDQESEKTLDWLTEKSCKAPSGSSTSSATTSGDANSSDNETGQAPAN